MNIVAMIPAEKESLLDVDSEFSYPLTIRESDCSVFIVESPSGIGVRIRPTLDENAKSGVAFNQNELISIDLIEHKKFQYTSPTSLLDSRPTKAGKFGGNDSTTIPLNGPFMRLSDDSGWVFGSKDGRKVIRQVPVHDGFWVMIVHNPPFGHCLRWHPVERDDFRARRCDRSFDPDIIGTSTQSDDDFVVYWPTQRLYCDKRVVHPISGVEFFRVQGTRGWVFNNRRSKIPYLLDDNCCRKGLFAFQNLKPAPMEIRAWATTEDSARVGRMVASQEIVIADMIIEIPQSTDNGIVVSFIHLVNGGWLFQKKENNKFLLGKVTIDYGYWVFKVVNESGISTSLQPMLKEVASQNVVRTFFCCNNLVKCDRKITSHSGASYYRVIDTQGWITEISDGMSMIEMLRSSTFPPVSERNDSTIKSTGWWDPQFVRGIAAVANEGNIEELDFDEVNRLIRFTSGNDAIVSVFFSTRTTGISIVDSSNSRLQVFRKNCTARQLLEIMNDPLSYVEKRFDSKNKKLTVINTSIGSGFVIEQQEEEVRTDLISTNVEVRSLKLKQLALLNSLTAFEAKSRNDALKIKEETDLLQKCIKESKISTPAPVPSSQPNLIRSVSIKRGKALLKTRILHESSKEKYACSVCRRVFHNVQYLNHHRRDVHGLECNRCFCIFTTPQLLKQHREVEGHW